MARNFAREEFYELVWSKPMTQLAKEFAISDVALHKICKKHGIPNPPVGWWAKKAAGKAVGQIPLPQARAGTGGSIAIASANLGPESSVLARAREEARILASEGIDNQTLPPHPVVARTLAKLRKAKPSDIGIVTAEGTGLVRCEVAATSIDRLSIILPRLVRATSLQGFQLVAEEGPARFRSATEAVSFSITELVRREKHVLTDAERAKEEAWQRKRDRAARSNSWNDDVYFKRPSFPEWDYHPTGQLSLEFEHVYFYQIGSPRRSFRDAKIQRLENMAGDIAVGLAVFAAAKTQDRLEREARERAIEEERRQRELAERIKHIEERRIAELGAVLTELDELSRLRRLTAMLPTEIPAQPMPRLAGFLVWAGEYLNKCEVRLSAKGLEKRFTAKHLFGDDDDHDFKPPPW